MIYRSGVLGEILRSVRKGRNDQRAKGEMEAVAESWLKIATEVWII